jgi:hypothetical protein
MNVKRRKQLVELGMDGRTILKWILKIIGYGWIHVAHDRVKLRALIYICFI